MSRQLRAFGAFWWDFVVGDDPLIALVVVGALTGTALLAHHHVAAWWLVPLTAIATLCLSTWREARSNVRTQRQETSAEWTGSDD
jgi:hypothetical protein